MNTHLQKIITIYSRGLERSCDKLKALYFHYQSTYDRQTWQNVNLPWLAFTHKVIWFFDYVVFMDHVEN